LRAKEQDNLSWFCFILLADFDQKIWNKQLKDYDQINLKVNLQRPAVNIEDPSPWILFYIKEDWRHFEVRSQELKKSSLRS
jgi:hypothetical protein